MDWVRAWICCCMLACVWFALASWSMCACICWEASSSSAALLAYSVGGVVASRTPSMICWIMAFALWNPSWLIVPPPLCLIALRASVKCLVKLIQVLSLMGFSFHLRMSLERKLARLRMIIPMLISCSGVSAAPAASAALAYLLIALKIVAIDLDGSRVSDSTSFFISLSSAWETSPYSANKYCMISVTVPVRTPDSSSIFSAR